MVEYCCYTCLKTIALVCGCWIRLVADRVWWLVCVKAVMILRDPESWDFLEQVSDSQLLNKDSVP
jgi:hypothetical protein